MYAGRDHAFIPAPSCTAANHMGQQWAEFPRGLTAYERTESPSRVCCLRRGLTRPPTPDTSSCPLNYPYYNVIGGQCYPSCRLLGRKSGGAWYIHANSGSYTTGDYYHHTVSGSSCSAIRFAGRRWEDFPGNSDAWETKKMPNQHCCKLKW